MDTIPWAMLRAIREAICRVWTFESLHDVHEIDRSDSIPETRFPDKPPIEAMDATCSGAKADLSKSCQLLIEVSK
jgi:hypothetical protein